MIIENTGIIGALSELSYLDEVTSKHGFIRWQWEYRRATYDYKMEDSSSNGTYFLRINTRAVEGKLESPHAVLAVEAVYVGKETFPHGLDYEAPIPESILKSCKQKLYELKMLLSDEEISSEMMRKNYPTLTRKATLFEAAKKMKEHGIGIIPVMDEERWIGVVTDRDLALNGYAENQPGSFSIGNIIRNDKVSVGSDHSIEEAMKLMIEQHLDGLPVTNNGMLEGMLFLEDLSARDYFEYELKDAIKESPAANTSTDRGISTHHI